MKSIAIIVMGESSKEYNFTDSWSDAGPIIEKYGIAVAAVANSEWMAQCTTKLDGPFKSGESHYSFKEYSSKSPLRAAMIVFLMMEGK